MMSATCIAALFLAWIALVGASETHVYNFNATYVTGNPDGVHARRMIGINGAWPIPTIRITEGDRVVIHLTNDLEKGVDTSLHFHGLFQQETNWMDGPQMATQCPVPFGHTFTYNFTVTAQYGTYWYHSHTGSQYSDGLRGLFIVEPKTKPDYYQQFDEEVSLTVSDWYHQESPMIMKSFMSRYNPTGAEPIPQNSLFNDTKNATWQVQPDTRYFLRIVNVGMFVTQHVFIEGHHFTVVEIDGVDVEPYECDSISIAVAQRYGVLVNTRPRGTGSFRFVNIIDKEMLDFHPDDLQIISTNWMSYPNTTTKPAPIHQHAYQSLIESLSPVDDMLLVPTLREPILGLPDYQIVVNFTMNTLGDGVQYAMFNDITYTPPKVPTLYTAMFANSSELANDVRIYGSNTNSFVLQEDEVIEIVLNNQDPGNHPFHLHGHVFQAIERLEAGEDEDSPIIYDPNEEKDLPPIPMQRDTILVRPNGYIVIRFKASNPGVWLFHCHVDWHLEQGLALTLIEAPSRLQEYKEKLPKSHFEACMKSNILVKANAAGNSFDWLDLTGENTQFEALPEGFTAKGYIALVISTLFGLYGIYSIYRYGMEDVKSDNSEELMHKLYAILEKYDTVDETTLRPLNKPFANDDDE